MTSRWSSALRALLAVRDETLHAITTPEQRARLGAVLHDRQTRFEAGLFEWEKRAFFEPPFPTSGRILLGAAGSGRELRSFVERGFDVVAFEPAEGLARAAELGFPSAKVVRAGYADLIARRPPLSHFLDGGFDAVVLGWGSLGQLTGAGEQRALFFALQQIAPDAPVVAGSSIRDRSAKMTRLRTTTRRVLGTLGARWLAAGDLRFNFESGFTTVLSPSEIEALAESAGYRADLREEHVIFRPSSAA